MVSLSGFGNKLILASYNEVGSVPSSSVFLKYFGKTSVNSSLIIIFFFFFQNSHVKPSDPELWSAWRFLFLADSIFTDNWPVHIFYISWLSL